MDHTHRSSVRKIQSSLTTRIAVCCLAAGLSFSPASHAADDSGPLKALLAESLAKGRGVTVHAAGAAISMVVTSVEGCCVVGRNAQSSRIVVRLDRIDAVVASF
ncbi:MULTISPECIES: hypothetical protein [unclassified Roseateles]|uniref:hypothetical protein n=1 Tax=unclassified Roseateles TaxID=2626991 RepID=UPI0006FF9EFF|nr:MULTISPECIES: hypothetical protein [unclassified Roseateles]KQW52216.1 hypothetical protein ASC81_06405 [Pelomonas sp. Root405]KRA78449.1 hypothetical protein ASD88_06410 [Pelomonas sp. Root662]